MMMMKCIVRPICLVEYIDLVTTIAVYTRALTRDKKITFTEMRHCKCKLSSGVIINKAIFHSNRRRK